MRPRQLSGNPIERILEELLQGKTLKILTE